MGRINREGNSNTERMLKMKKDKPVQILMLASQEILINQNDGGKRVSYRNYKMLQDIFGQENVSLIMYTNNREQSKGEKNIYRVQAYDSFIRRGFNILSGRLFTDREGEEFVVRLIIEKKIDILFLDRSLYGTLVKRIRKERIHCRIWVYEHNLEVEYFKNKLKKYPLISAIIGNRISESEKLTYKTSDCNLGLTLRDAKKVQKTYGCDIKYIIPTTFQDVYFQDRSVKHKSGVVSLLFIGSMFAPNYDGVLWFVKEVMSQLPEIELTIVGRDFEKKRKELQQKNVTVVGTVEDLEEYYYSDSVMVMPIFYGDGQKVKTAEAMMYGKIILATDEALEGYAVEGVEGFYRCNSAENFVTAINQLKEKNESDFKKMQNSVREIFLNNYSYDNMIDKYKEVLWKEWIGEDD
jgi:glycosyltransferase involved in cell wall biosynthesis